MTGLYRAEFALDGSVVPNSDALAGGTHALISRLPGLHGNGEIFVLAGNWTAGSLAAVEYVTRPAYARDLVRRLRLPSGEMPRHFEIIVKSEFRQGAPVRVSYIAHHVR